MHLAKLLTEKKTNMEAPDLAPLTEQIAFGALIILISLFIVGAAIWLGQYVLTTCLAASVLSQSP